MSPLRRFFVGIHKTKQEFYHTFLQTPKLNIMNYPLAHAYTAIVPAVKTQRLLRERSFFRFYLKHLPYDLN